MEFIETPPVIDPQLDELLKWFYSNYDELKQIVSNKKSNPYEICGGCGKKNKWCACGVN